jgi:alkylated DNA repair dioxygenase AlkB
MGIIQRQLFEVSEPWPAGFSYAADFITPDDEASLLATISTLPLTEARYKEYTSKRRIVSYGGTYDFTANELIPAGPIPDFLKPLRDRLAEWVQLPPHEFTHALIAEYKTGTQLGWHRDVPDFENVAGVSLGGPCRMRLRPYPHRKGKKVEVLTVNLEPRSAYLMRGEARWSWQHSIPPTKMTRYSITFRSARTSARSKRSEARLSESRTPSE